MPTLHSVALNRKKQQYIHSAIPVHVDIIVLDHHHSPQLSQNWNSLLPPLLIPILVKLAFGLARPHGAAPHHTNYHPQMPSEWIGGNRLTGTIIFSGDYTRDGDHYSFMTQSFKLVLRKNVDLKN